MNNLKLFYKALLDQVTNQISKTASGTPKDGKMRHWRSVRKKARMNPPKISKQTSADNKAKQILGPRLGLESSNSVILTPAKQCD